jgi:hypothetical protein
MRSRLLQWLHGSERPAPEHPPSRRCFELVGRARVALEVADRALHPSEPFAHGTAEGTACELYAQAVYWALSARMELERPSGASIESLEPPSVLLDHADPRVLASAEGAASVQRVRDLLSKSFIDLAQLEAKDRTTGAKQLRAFAQRLLEPLDSEQRRLERRWARRAARLIGVLAALGVASLVMRWIGEGRERTRDLAPKATWNANPFWMGCESPAQECPDHQDFFFHTHEAMDPSITFDLHEERQISALSIENRRDCCGERAVPLVVEVSSDGRTFTEIARRTKQFISWHPHFRTVRARWVKLHVADRTMLHLARVRILP